MIDESFYQFIVADNNQAMQFCPVFLYFSKSGFIVEYFTFILRGYTRLKPSENVYGLMQISRFFTIFT